MIFLVLNFQGRFEALNELFLAHKFSIENQGFCLGPLKICTSWLYLSDEVPSAPNEDHMKNLCPREVDISTTPTRAHTYFGVLYSRVRVLDA
jgi:hypothetical protein